MYDTKNQMNHNPAHHPKSGRRLESGGPGARRRARFAFSQRFASRVLSLSAAIFHFATATGMAGPALAGAGRRAGGDKAESRTSIERSSVATPTSDESDDVASGPIIVLPCDDFDGDGFGVGGGAGCGAGDAPDCDDRNGAIYPGARERCNGRDDDCDGRIDEDFDRDGDGEVVCCGGFEKNKRAAMIACMGGPEERPVGESIRECLEAFDDDTDGDLDLRDIASSFNNFTTECDDVTECPPGTHLLSKSGVRGIPNPDTFDPAGATSQDFRCIADNACTDIDCGDNGYCVEFDGEPTCACRPGYVGGSCEDCAVGYERNDQGECEIGRACRELYCSGQGDCVDGGVEIKCECDEGISGEFCEIGWTGDPNELHPPTRVRIHGTESSIRAAECRPLWIDVTGTGNVATDFVWKLEGPGSLDTNEGLDVQYCAPTSFMGEKSETARIEVCLASFPNECAERFISVDPTYGIGSTGQAHEIFEPIDEAMKRFMRYRCVGAATLGISVFGKPVYLRGYGNLSGAPTDDPEYLEACGDVYDVQDAVPGIALPPPSPTQPNTPMRIGSNSKAVGAAILRHAVKDQILGNPSAPESDVESLVLCDNPDLLPQVIYDVMCGNVAPPLTLPTLSGNRPVCGSDDPCPYGGTCSENGSNDFCTDCPAGFTGIDCATNLSTCGDLSSAADSRLQDMTLGHILGHTSGMPRSVPSGQTSITPNFDKLRNLTTEADWIDQQQQVMNGTGFPSGGFAAEFPNFAAAVAAIIPGYFVPRPNMDDVMVTRFGTCLENAPGANTQYSNTGYAFLGHIVEHITNQSFAGDEGRPDEHWGSALEDFTQGRLGFPLDDQATPEGIFYSPNVFRLRKPEEPIYRHWVGGSYYNTARTWKRPHCEWDGETCNFDDFVSGAQKFNWDFQQHNELRAYSGGNNDGSGTTGTLAAEPEAFLKFMSRYFVGGDGNSPRYGKPRCPNGDCVWNLTTSHNGARDGTFSYVFQFGGATKGGKTCSTEGECGSIEVCDGTGQDRMLPRSCRGSADGNGAFTGGLCTLWDEYYIPPVDTCTDIIQDDFANLECHALELPLGVDIFVTINQGRDKKCAEAEALGEGHPDYYTCSSAYGLLKDFIYYGVAHVQWPPNPYVLWPGPDLDGDGGLSSPSFAPNTGSTSSAAIVEQLSGGAQGGVAGGGGLQCCGDGIRNFGEVCDGFDFGGKTCATYGYEMGSLSCNDCLQIITNGCSGGIGLPPGSYNECDCGFQGGESCSDCTDPSTCNPADDGFCIGGPCLPVDEGNHNGKLSPFSSFHPDGDYQDPYGGLYFCPGSDVVCSAEGAWGVCKQCGDQETETTTKVGCPCNLNSDCESPTLNLTCWGETSGGGPGFCYDAVDGPPDWQCREGACGMAPWYGDDNMYCEHYSTSGEARCEPFVTCNNILSEVCAGVGKICACIDDNGDGDCDENAAGCTTNDCCDFECYENSHCSQAFGWPFGYQCVNNNCVP